MWPELPPLSQWTQMLRGGQATLSTRDPKPDGKVPSSLGSRAPAVLIGVFSAQKLKNFLGGDSGSLRRVVGKGPHAKNR